MLLIQFIHFDIFLCATLFAWGKTSYMEKYKTESEDHTSKSQGTNAGTLTLPFHLDWLGGGHHAGLLRPSR